MKGLSIGASVAWQVSAWETAGLSNQFIEKEHIFIGILSLEKVLHMGEGEELDPKEKQELQGENKTIEEVLRAFKLDPTQLRRKVRNRICKGDYTRSEKVVHRSEECKRVFKRAGEVAGSGDASSLHLLAVILEEPGDIIGCILTEAGVRPEDMRENILHLLQSLKEQELPQYLALNQQAGQKAGQASTHYIDLYGLDLTREAREKRLGPIIGRRQEILQVIQTLARSTKNNPVLVGEAGVGKTAIVEALAIRVVEGKDPHILAGKRIIELNIEALVGGTKYRGEFEERLNSIIEEARSHPEIILFIDELHKVVSAGSGEGCMDAANIMKPALARGDLRCIGATTIAEYRRYIEADSALERRFEKIIVDESSPDETLDILRGICPKWKEHHQVQITDQALKAAVELSIRFDIDHRLPDKAIDLVDKAGARTRIPMLSMPEMGGAVDDVETCEDDVESYGEVTELTIAQVLSEKKGVPLEIVTGHLECLGQSRLLELESFIKKRLIGQNEAIERVCQRLLMAHAGLAKRRGPLAVFLFLGPTGVGKTEMGRLLAAFLFGSESEMIRLDMSEYMEKHSIAKLIGSPPGYVGYEEEGQLTGKLRTKPYSVVLLDEIEKAHPQVLDLFLQVFDEGRLTDSKGRTADARNALFIMTSNIPADKRIGFIYSNTDESRTEVLNEVRKRFRREFINRIDEQIIFLSLNEEAVRKILRPMLDEIIDDLWKRYNVLLEVCEEARKFLAQAGYNPDYGVRELHRSVERLIQTKLSRLILTGEIKSFNHWQVICRGNELSIVPYDYGTYAE